MDNKAYVSQGFNYDERIRELRDVMLKYDGVTIAFSGGHDSILAFHMAMEAAPEKVLGAVYANTMTGAKETRQYIYDMVKHYDVPLYEGKPPQKGRYEQLIITWGFPSPALHSIIYRELKGKILTSLKSKIAKEHGIKATRIASITGLRKYESQRRNGFVEFVLERKDKAGKLQDTLIQPIYDIHIYERDSIIDSLGIPRNAYADYMKSSYECQCMANMSKGERERRAIVSPEYEQIDALRERLVATAFELQNALISAGVWDEEDRTIKDGRLTQGWHLSKPIKAEELDNQDPFNLCQSCIGGRAFDGTGAYDDAMENNPVKFSFAEVRDLNEGAAT